jgi:TolB-like protein/class 3 adenylate cyclase
VASEGTEHRLAAVLVADVVGYSRLMAENQDATVRTVTAYREEVELLVRQHQGRLVDFTGDEFLAEFPTPLESVRCAVEIQKVLEARNSELPSERRMQFRMGIHLGDVAVQGKRLFGDGVNIAARLQALADAGGVCISGHVHDLVHTKLGLGFDDLGSKSLDNIPDPVRVYRVEIEAEAAPLETPWGPARRAVLGVAVVLLLGAVAVAGWRILAGGSAGPAEAPIRSIAVLPLENLSGDPEQEYFADGMTEALIGDLAKIGSLRVISRTSVIQYKRAPKPLRQIAKELDVDGIIEGTVMRAGDRVRITAQLIDARDDRHLWSDRYDRALGDILALHNDVARAVAEQVRLELNAEERASLTASRTVDPRAYDAYLRGLQLRGPVHLVVAWGPKSIEQFERAVGMDPEFAEGYAALANCHIWLGAVANRRSEFPKAREAAQRALDLDDRLGVPYTALGYIQLASDWDFTGARRAYERAAQLSPSDATALNDYAWYLLVVGRTEEALEVMERLLRVAPLDLFYRQVRLRNFNYAGQYERALEEAERLRELGPDWVAHSVGDTYTLLGRHEEAHRAYLAADERCGAPCDWQREARKRGWSEGGREGSARAWIEAATDQAVSPTVIAYVYSWIGDKDHAFASLERAYRERDPRLIELKVLPFSDSVRSDPRFDDLLRRIGFPEN